MPFFSWNRLWSNNRQATQSPEPPLPPPSSDSPSALVESERPPSSSNNHRRYSKDSEGYPSWLPKRPPPPAPRSTFHSSNINLPLDTSIPDLPQPRTATPAMVGGRKPTPRSVRIVSLHDDYGEKVREPTDQTRVPSGPMHARAWSRATAPTLFSEPTYPRAPRPRFRAKGLHLELLESPDWTIKLLFHLYRIIVFLHIPLQTYLDFNVVFMLYQVAKYPNPESSTIPGSGRNWALGAAAYATCWLFWIVGVFIVYELIYSFSRRWRVKCPLIYPIYFSSPAFNLVAITSYTNFCFLYHIRFSSLKGTNGATDSTSDVPNAVSQQGRPRSIRTFLSETFSFYSQNLPTVALLLPRAALSLALLLAFTSPDPVLVAFANQNQGLARDDTFFRANGTLTAYAAGVLWANVAWTGWRASILLFSWVGLLVASGQPCAGLCGPRYRWEEEDVEKRKSTYSAYSADHPDDISEQYREHDALQWNWRDDTRERVIESWEFCLTSKHPRWSSGGGFAGLPKLGKEASDQSHLLTPATETYPYENMQQILAAVGLGGVSPPARRGVLSDDFFRGPHSRHASEQIEIVPRTETPPELKPTDAQRIPDVVRKRESKGKKPERYPYPFTAEGAHLSSEDKIAVPFPPSPLPSDENGHEKPSESTSGSPEDEDGLDEDADVEEEEEADDEEKEVGTGEPRTSGSMSSLGNPVSSRYPFQFRRPTRGTNTSHSSGGAYSHSHSHSHSNSYSMNNRSVHSRVSGATQSTGNMESSDSHSPRSRYTTSSGSMAGTSSSGPVSPTLPVGSGIPMPPRHPRARGRAGTVPLPSGQSSPSPDSVAFPRSAERIRAESNITQAFGVPVPRHDEPVPPLPQDSHTESEAHPEDDPDELAEEEGEEEDEVGLLSNASSRGPSPRSSFIGVRHHGSSSSFTALRHRASNSFSQSLAHLQHAARTRHRSHESASGSGSGSRSSSNARSNHSAGSSISVAVRSRAQSLMQGAAGDRSRSHSSLENLNMVIEGRRSRANSSMARLEEDAPASADVSYSSNSDARTTQTHSRSGSTSGTGSASAEGHTFGRPLPAAQIRPQIAEPVEEVTEGSPSSPLSPTSPRSTSQPPSTAPSATPSQVFSERTVTPFLGPSNVSSSPPQPSFISSAPPSFVTDPPTVEGATTDESMGRHAGQNWTAENRDLDMHERTGGTYRPT